MGLYECRCGDCSIEFNMVLESRAGIKKIICPECGGQDLTIVREVPPMPPVTNFGGG